MDIVVRRFRRPWPQWARIAVRTFGGVALLLGVAFWFFVGRTLPSCSGAIEGAAGVSAPVRIFCDAHGVPHIFAENRADAAWALGWLHADNRFFQMELQRRAGQGRLAEVLGPDGLEMDKLMRVLGLYRLAETDVGVLSPEARAALDSYVLGVNAWLRARDSRLPPEFRILGLRPETWKPADSLVWARLMALQLSNNMRHEVLRERLAALAPVARWKKIFLEGSNDDPVTTQPVAGKRADLSPGPLEKAFDQLGGLTGLDHAASNEWVVAGSRTTTGSPILANDPHLGLGAPILWFLARLVTPGLDVRGATVPGLPVVLLGQNGGVAWGFTTTGSDVQDLFRETLDPKDPAKYLTPSGPRPFLERQETIRVKGMADVRLTVRASRHGPILSDHDPEMARLAGEGRALALAFTGLIPQNTTAEALFRMNAAPDAESFLKALPLFQAPPQNIMLADRAGAIGFVAAGRVPVRKKGADGLRPAEGASGKADWVGFVPWTWWPQRRDPATGFLFNANNAVVSGASRYFLGADWEEPFRARRLQELLAAPEKHDLAASARMQADTVSLAAREVLPLLLRLKPEGARQEEALALLRGWDARMDKDRPEPLIFEAWLLALNRALFYGQNGDILREKGPLRAHYLGDFLTDPEAFWCSPQGQALRDGRREEAAKLSPKGDCAPVVRAALDAALDDLTRRQGATLADWRWGREHRTVLVHKLYEKIPGLRWLSDLGAPSSGGFYALDRGGSFAMTGDHPFARTQGGGFRGIYDLADPARSRFMIATGQAGSPFARHYGDLAPLWREVKGIALTGTEAALREEGAEMLRFTPAGQAGR